MNEIKGLFPSNPPKPMTELGMVCRIFEVPQMRILGCESLGNVAGPTSDEKQIGSGTVNEADLLQLVTGFGGRQLR